MRSVPGPTLDEQRRTETGQKSLIDCHVHLAALPDGDNGCFISPKCSKPALSFSPVETRPFSGPSARSQPEISRPSADGTARLTACRKRCCSAWMAIYDRTGLLNRQHTDFLISNDYVFKTVRGLSGYVSCRSPINPQREDAVDEVHRCADAGAVLVKVFPNAQHFDPADENTDRFTGRWHNEVALLESCRLRIQSDRQGSIARGSRPAPARALEEGVTVIAAHACSYGLMFYEKFIPTFRDLCCVIRTSMPTFRPLPCRID